VASARASRCRGALHGQLARGAAWPTGGFALVRRCEASTDSSRRAALRCGERGAWVEQLREWPEAGCGGGPKPSSATVYSPRARARVL
jgi:hypothetical protein